MKPLIFKKIKFLFLPLSLIVKWIVLIRHFLYDNGLLKSHYFTNVTVVVIGNLSLGGTGKTPMAQYILDTLSSRFRVAMLSRGYGRKSKGFRWVHTHSCYDEVGDEPLLIKRNMPGIPVAVCENRVQGIRKILYEYADTQVVVLDDAYQHRALRPHVSILLTTFDCPFSQDYLFPAGSLRDIRARAGVADSIVVTKTPAAALPVQKESLKASIAKYSSADVFFSTFVNHVYKPMQKEPEDISGKRVVLVSTVANPTYLFKFLSDSKAYLQKTHIYRDHYPISDQLWTLILSECKRNDWLCVMTEKELVKLSENLKGQFSDILRIISIQFAIENKSNFFSIIYNKMLI